MENKYLRTAVSAFLLIFGWIMGDLHGKSTQATTHLCATFKQSGAELQLDSSLTLHLDDGQILAVLDASELKAVLGDDRLQFHACPMKK